MSIVGDIKVALSLDFLDALERLPRAQQKKARRFVRNFQRQPTASGYNFERVEAAADPRMRSVRIDQTYRAILLHPDEGNVYLVLWVDHHDAAYDWAKRRTCEVNPETGSLQVFTVDQAARAPEPAEARPDDPPADKPDDRSPLFEAFRDRELAQIGVPAELIDRVRLMRTMADLAQAADELPQEVHEALFFLASGESIEDIWRQVVLRADTPEVDTADLSTALENPNTRRSFVVVDDENLEEVLEMALEKWRVFLHPMQRKLVELDVNGPVRVLGGAGTGKTVVALHRAIWLAERLQDDTSRVLFTTFTRNLAADIEANLARLADGPILSRIDVVNLDRWVQNFLREQGYPYQIKYFGTGEGTLDDLWERALALAPPDLDVPLSFWREEWEHVVQAQGCASLRDYLRARRRGRGVALSRAARRAAWSVFEEYRNLLDDRGFKERADAIRDARTLLARAGDILPYRHLLVDEAQDMGEEAFKLLRQIVPEESANDLFVVGDGHQRIYQRKVIMKHCGIHIVGRNRSHRLRINYRTTDEIRRFAVGLLEGVPYDDLDGQPDSQHDYTSLMHGAAPEVARCATFADEIERIVSFVGGPDDDRLASTCLVARTQKQINQYAAALAERGIPVAPISRSQYDDRRAPGLRVATMHRVKGLEFDRVVVAGVNQDKVPLAAILRQTADAAVREDIEKRERALFYVALTRAKTHALVTTSGQPSPWL